MVTLPRKKRLTRTESLRVTNLIKQGLTRGTVQRKLRSEKISISSKQFQEKWERFSTMEVMVKRFERARLSTKITPIYFRKARGSTRMENNHVVVFTIKIIGALGDTSISTMVIGFDRTLKKIKILELIQEAITDLIKDSPNVDVEFQEIIGLYSKKGKLLKPKTRKRKKA